MFYKKILNPKRISNTYNYEYDLLGNRIYMEKVSEDSIVAEWYRYVYNNSNQLVSEKLCEDVEGANTIKWGIHELVVRQDGEGHWGERILQIIFE